MPAVDLIDFEFGSGPRKNDYWHTEQDTLDKLSAASLATMGRVVIQMVNALRALPETQCGDGLTPDRKTGVRSPRFK